MTYKEKSRTPILLRILFFLNIILGLSMIGAYLSTHISPNTFPYIYFLGLGYPILLGLMLLFILFWLLFKRKYVWFNLIIIAVGWNHLNDFYAFSLSSEAVKEKFIKVISYNVRVFNLYDVEHRIEKRDAIFKFLKQEDADVICFQEFYHQEGTSDFQTKNILLESLNTKFYQERYTHKMRGDKYFGVATFTKFLIVNKGEIAFENDDNNFCIYTDILKHGDTVRVFNAHIGSIRFQDKDYAFFGDQETGKIYQRTAAEQRILRRLKSAYEKRAVQIEKIQKEILVSPYKVIFCGDLNDTPISYCYRRLSNCLEDAFTEAGSGVGTTYIGKIPSNRIDYIFHSSDMTTAKFKTHDLDYSDHKPISCTINL